VIQLSSEHNLEKGSPQRIWLSGQLEHLDRKQFPWLIVTLHRPLYSSEDYEDDSIVADHLRMSLEEEFLQYRVDLVLAGHYHAYERTCPVAKFVCQTKELSSPSIVHVVTGAAGMHLDSAPFFEQVSWRKAYTQEWGFTTIRVNKRNLNLQYRSSMDGHVIDEFELSK
jgi:hypothetical protein